MCREFINNSLFSSAVRHIVTRHNHHPNDIDFLAVVAL